VIPSALQILSCTAALTFALAACTTTIPEPQTIVVPSGLSREQVRNALVAALQPRRQATRPPVVATNVATILAAEVLYGDRPWWQPEGEEPGAIYASYAKDKHYLRVRIDYSQSAVAVQIVGSRNLDQSGTRIHANAVVWVENLEQAIRVEMGRAAVPLR